MVRITFAISLCVAFSSFRGSAQAAECGGVSVSDTVEVGGEKLVLNGLGLREITMFKINVYVAALYLKEKSSNGDEISNADQTKLIRLSFLRDVSRKDMRKAILEGIQASSPNEWPQLQDRAQRFFELLPAFEKGQTLTLSYAPGKGVQVKAPGKGSGVIEGFDFARALFHVWLGERPNGERLKNGLLGGTCS